MPNYDEVLADTVQNWDEHVKRWEAEKRKAEQAPIVRKERIKRGIWENLFAYGAGAGVIVQVMLWYQWLALR